MTIFPEFEKQLVELASEAARSTRRRRLPSAGIVITTLASATAVAIAILALALLGHTRVAPHRHPAHQPASPPTQPAVASQLSVFTRAPTSADALPAADRTYLRQEHGSAHPDVADARQVSASDGQKAYLVPASKGVCVINTNEAFCSPSTSWPGADAIDLCSPRLPVGQIEIEWLLPDGATNVNLSAPSTTVKTFAPGFNVYIARLSVHRPLPSSIQWDSPGGQHHSVNAGIPPNAQSERCAHPTGATAHRKAPRRRLTAKTVTTHQP